MVFSSLIFLYFYLPVVLIVYYISPAKMKNIILLVSGLFFYAWGEPVYVLVMLFSTALDYTMGRLIHHFDAFPKKRTVFLILSVVINIGLLGVFKYSSFIIQNLNGLLGVNIPDPQLPLPIGISFYTFQSLSYTIDVYWRKIKVQKNFVSFAAFVTMFPQIVAGPIVRYEDVEREIDKRAVNVDKAGEGIGLFIKGLSKKVLLANNIGLLWVQVEAMDYTEISVVTAWLGILAFAFQIYFDFSGYTDMARGLGKMLGFEFPQNFNFPYISRSISEFWRRWHMTLGSWFRAYVYIPLGGNRCGLIKQLRNLAIVWFLTGLWHGASWNFVLWGLYFGLLIIIERLGLGKILNKLPALVSMLYTFVMVLFGWVLFETENLIKAGQYFSAMFGGTGVLMDSSAKYMASSNALLFIICIFASTQLFGKLLEKLKQWSVLAVTYSAPVIELLLMLACTAYLVDATYNPFLYFRF